MQRNIPTSKSTPIISCLMVTQQDRLAETAQAIDCFTRQQLEPIELVIVHDSGSSYHEELQCLAENDPYANIRVFQEPSGHTLGWLRNRSLQHATAELFCQWDDDDFNHPARLKTQYDLMLHEGSDFCFMTDQLHLFTEQNFLFWDDWSSRPPPYDLIENTVLGERALVGNYLDLPRGEDTAIIDHITHHQYKVSRLSGMGWLYTYVFNCRNTWDFRHHSEISLLRRLNTTELLPHTDTLRAELKQYEFPFDHIFMPHDEGKIEFKF